MDAKSGLCAIASSSREVSHLGMQSDGDGDDDDHDDDDDELCTPGITSSYYDNLRIPCISSQVQRHN